MPGLTRDLYSSVIPGLTRVLYGSVIPGLIRDLYSSVIPGLTRDLYSSVMPDLIGHPDCLDTHFRGDDGYETPHTTLIKSSG